MVPIVTFCIHPRHLLICLDRFTIPTVSQSQHLYWFRQPRVFRRLTWLLSYRVIVRSDQSLYQLDELEKSLNHISEKCRNNPSATIFLGGDFNAREIDWQIGSTAPGAKQGKICERVLEILGLNLLEQQVREWTREKSILDLFCTNKPGLVKSCYSIPGISDHEVVLADCDVRAQITKKVPRKIFQWSRANWDHLRKITSEFKDKFLSDYSTKSVNENYNSLCAHINSILDEHVPSKMSKPRQSSPWFNSSLKRMCRKKQRLFNAAKRTHKKPTGTGIKLTRKTPLRHYEGPAGHI